MTVLDMNPATLPADTRALYETMAARRKAHGEGFGGPYLALLNHPELARASVGSVAGFMSSTVMARFPDQVSLRRYSWYDHARTPALKS